MASPLLDTELKVYPQSGLTFPWAEYTSTHGSTFDASFGTEGVGLGMNMILNWSDLVAPFTGGNAIGQLLGYSEVIPTTVGMNNAFKQIHRVVPFAHQQWPQLWCTKITSCRGIGPAGFSQGFINPVTMQAQGPVSSYPYALLTLQFTRPPYPVLEDAAVVGEDGETQQEWLRYLDRKWEISSQILTRESTQFTWREGADSGPSPSGWNLKGSPGFPVVKTKLTRKWYQIPEAAVYNAYGLPVNMLYNRSTANPFPATVNITGFLGFAPDTLLYESAEIIPRPLQIPPELMGVIGESVQLQYDIVFHFVFFDPIKNPVVANGIPMTNTLRGWNCLPWPQDAYWYPASALGYSATVVTGTSGNGVPIVLKLNAAPYNTGDIVNVSGVGGNTAADGTWIVTRVGGPGVYTYLLNNRQAEGVAPDNIGNGDWTSGGATKGGAPVLRSMEFRDLFTVIQ
jgi:hypothetical protein